MISLAFFFFYVYGDHRHLHVLTHSFPTRRSSYLLDHHRNGVPVARNGPAVHPGGAVRRRAGDGGVPLARGGRVRHDQSDRRSDLLRHRPAPARDRGLGALSMVAGGDVREPAARAEPPALTEPHARAEPPVTGRLAGFFGCDLLYSFRRS